MAFCRQIPSIEEKAVLIRIMIVVTAEKTVAPAVLVAPCECEKPERRQA